MEPYQIVLLVGFGLILFGLWVGVAWKFGELVEDATRSRWLGGVAWLTALITGPTLATAAVLYLQ